MGLVSRLPLKRLAKLLKKDGWLIVADAHPDNLQENPLYGVSLEKRRVAIRLRRIDHGLLQASAYEMGLTLSEPVTIYKADRTPYAIVCAYHLSDGNK